MAPRSAKLDEVKLHAGYVTTTTSIRTIFPLSGGAFQS
jgi:hypothetical protein